MSTISHFIYSIPTEFAREGLKGFSVAQSFAVCSFVYAAKTTHSDFHPVDLLCVNQSDPRVCNRAFYPCTLGDFDQTKEVF